MLSRYILASAILSLPLKGHLFAGVILLKDLEVRVPLRLELVICIFATIALSDRALSRACCAICVALIACDAWSPCRILS